MFFPMSYNNSLEWLFIAGAFEDELICLQDMFHSSDSGLKGLVVSVTSVY